jgi:uncharacterized membrane protein YhaH (DUF805 family)
MVASRQQTHSAAGFAAQSSMTVDSSPQAPLSSFDDALPIPRILFSFRGRVPRKTWWLYGVLGPLLISAMAEMLLGIVGVAERSAESLSSLLLLWPCVAVSAKRWHDRDKSGWWTLILIVPVLGMIWTLVENGLRRGTVGPNRFGADLTGQF